MEETIGAVLDQSIAEPTRRRYDSAWKRYMAWCRQLGETPLPVTEDTAMAYVVALVREGLRVKTVKYHLAGLRMAQIKAGMAAPEWGGHVKAGPAQEGPGKDRGLGREGEAEKRAGEVESHAGHESSVEGKRREGNHAVGSRMHVFLWVSEGRRGAGPGEGRVRREGPFGLGRRADGGRSEPQVDPVED